MSDRLTTISKGVTIAFGLVTIPVDVASAKASDEEGNTNVCTGDLHTHDEDGVLTITPTHQPSKITQPKTCATCKTTVPEQSVKKARKVGDRLVVIDPEALKGAKNYEPFVKRYELTAHPAPQVTSGTISGKYVYYLLPAKGAEADYAAFAELVDAHPELAFCGRWAPRTAVGMYQLTTREVKGGQPVLVMFERTLANALKTAPVLTLAPAESKIALAEKVLKENRRTLVTKFAPAAYADESVAAIAALVDAVADEEQAASVTAADPMLDALNAMLAKKAPRAPRKPRIKAVA